MYRFGTDEAGKGPVLGSMFAACVHVEPGADPAVLDEVRDSKRLSPERRESLADALRAAPSVSVGVAEVPVERIDDPATDMNGLAVEVHASALSGVVEPGDRGVADAADTDASRFGRRVAHAATRDVAVDAEHGADDTYPLVAAASVVAKVERDAHVEALAAEHGDLGSGYPSDPTTRRFLESYVDERGRLPDCARETWSTSRDVLAAVEQSGLDAFPAADHSG